MLNFGVLINHCEEPMLLSFFKIFNLKPTYIIDTIRDINTQDLKNEGIKAIIFDLDNTLMAPYTGRFTEEVIMWINAVRKEFKIAILSNNTHSGYIKNIKSEIDFPIYGRAIKPMKKTALKLIEELNVQPSECAMVGDNALTDVFLGLRLNMLTILVSPLVKYQESWIAQALQRMGKVIVKSARKTFNPVITEE